MAAEDEIQPVSDTIIPLEGIARVAHAAICEYQRVTGIPPFSPWDQCAEPWRQEQVARVAEYLDAPDLADKDGDDYKELRLCVISALA